MPCAQLATSAFRRAIAEASVRARRVAPASDRVKTTASQLAALGPDGLILTRPAASADVRVKEAGSSLPTAGRPPARGNAGGTNTRYGP